MSRKETRKADRKHKRQARNLATPRKRQRMSDDLDLDSEVESAVSLEDAASPPKFSDSGVKKDNTPAINPVTTASPPLLSHSQPSGDIPRSVRRKLDEDDLEIAALESKLGLKKSKKLPKAFEDEGLAELLEGLSDVDNQGSDSDDDTRTWLKAKRQRAKSATRERTRTKDPVVFKDDNAIISDNSSEGDVSDGVGSDPELHFSDDGRSDDAPAEQAQKRVKENPYVAPVNNATGINVKYIPPSLRVSAEVAPQSSIRLRRQIQGLINRLTEANLISILGEVESLYRDNARQSVTSTLVDIILTAVCEPTSLPDTLIILHAGFIAAAYKIIGTDFGAYVVQKITELFDQQYSRAVSITTPANISKETSNLIGLLSALYIYNVIGCNLMFDYIRLLLQALTELNAELLLKIIRASGVQLRQDDPSALKDIVVMLRPAVMKVGEQNLSIRTKFMIEAINDVKDNKVKTGSATSHVNSEHTIRMKKMLGSLNNRAIKASEPLRIGLKDIQDLDKRGKWWLIGASWTGKHADGDEPDGSRTNHEALKAPPNKSREIETSDIYQLAREQRMNTDIRRAIFIALMSASDCHDAYMRVTKLRLKRAQEQEIPKVLLHCAGAEENYNPYYTLVAKRLCEDRRLKMAFQFCLWDQFKKMGETSDDTDDHDYNDHEVEGNRQVVNIAKLYGTLVAEGALALHILKNLNLLSLQLETSAFLEVMFITVFLHAERSGETCRDAQSISAIMDRVADLPQLALSMRHFLKRTVLPTDLVSSKKDKATVSWACKIAMRTLGLAGQEIAT